MNSGSIFVSYSRKDLNFAMRLTTELKKLGANIWIDQSGIGLGDNWDTSIEDALDAANILLLLVSKTSSASQNVQDEVSWAKNTDKKIIPLLIEDCEMPMRWQRMQYADFNSSPEKAIKSIIEVLNLEFQVVSNLQNLIQNLARSKQDKNKNTDTQNKYDNGDDKIADLLVSEKEIDRATIMHIKAVKKNWILIGIVFGFSIISFVVLITVFDKNQTLWVSIIGCLLINLLSVKPYGGIIRRTKNMELMDLLKLKRNRLTRIINRLADNEIEKFNIEFNNYISA